MTRTLWRFAVLFVVALALATVAVLGVRGQTSRVPPREFNKGMVDQLKAKAQGKTLAFADGRVNRMPPKGTIPWGRGTDAPDGAFAFDLEAAYASKRMPGAFDARRIQHGRAMYTRYCALCHGDLGDGRGITTRFGMNQPPSYHSDSMRALSDGAMFKVITDGKGTMGPLAGRLPPEDRWAAVAWVRVLQRARNAQLAELPDEQRRALEEQPK